MSLLDRENFFEIPEAESHQDKSQIKFSKLIQNFRQSKSLDIPDSATFNLEFQNCASSLNNICDGTYQSSANPLYLKQEDDVSSQVLKKSIETQRNNNISVQSSYERVKDEQEYYVISEIIKNLLTTEQSHLQRLEEIVTIQLPYIKKNYGELFSNKIFGDVDDIYKLTKTYFSQLQECEQNIETICKTIISMEGLFQKYLTFVFIAHKVDEKFIALTQFQIACDIKDKYGKKDIKENVRRVFDRITQYANIMESLKKEVYKVAEKCSSRNLQQFLGNTVKYVEEATALTKKYKERCNMNLFLSDVKLCSKNFGIHGELILVNDFEAREGDQHFYARIFLFKKLVMITSLPRLHNKECKFECGISNKVLGVGLIGEYEAIDISEGKSRKFIITSNKSGIIRRWYGELNKIMQVEVAGTKERISRKHGTMELHSSPHKEERE